MNKLRWLFRIEPHAAHGLPVPDVAAPSGGITPFGLLVNLMTPGQDLCVQPGMALGRCDISNLTVTMLVVVPSNEASHPAPGMIKIGKPACRVIRPILASTKQRLGVSIVVGDT